jgi:hypothetical protein
VKAPEATDAAGNEGQDEGEEVVEKADGEAEEEEDVEDEDEPVTAVAVPKPTTT